MAPKFPFFTRHTQKYKQKERKKTRLYVDPKQWGSLNNLDVKRLTFFSIVSLVK